MKTYTTPVFEIELLNGEDILTMSVSKSDDCYYESWEDIMNSLYIK